MIFNEDSSKILGCFEQLLKRSKNEFEKLPEETLWTEQRGDKVLYYSVSGKKSHRNRKMINTDPELIASLVRKEYLAKEIQMLERNILAIKKMKNIYDKEFVEPTVDNVVSLISKKRQADVYKRYFYNKVEESVQFPIDYTRYGKDVIDWAMADYRRSDYRKEELKHRSSYGLLVRSKSEITIVEKYYEHKIPFRYEEVIEKDGVVVIPDFIVPDKYGKFWIWEHCGMPDNPDYMNRHKRKIEIYEKMGIVPWKNLIVTYDNEYGSIDVKTIEAEIKGKLL